MSIIERFCETNYTDYEDFKARYRVRIPEQFNFGFDVVDAAAAEDPHKKALVWCNDKGEERIFTFGDISRLSNRAAHAFASMGIGKGSAVMLIVKRHWQFWVCMTALHKLGAVAIPATHLLTPKDVAYRVEAADIKLIVAAADDYIRTSILEGEKLCGIPFMKASVGGAQADFTDFDALCQTCSEQAPARPALDGEDRMLMYFTSGTTGMPKMVAHPFSYPLGHILTARFWQNLRPDDLHFTLADTGWAKCAWGKFYGQWICQAAVFVYDYDTRFAPLDMAKMIHKHRITTFCAPPTVYRFLIKEDLTGIDLSSLRACYIAGEPLNAEVFNRWKDLTGLELREGFGQTETPVLIANTPWLTPKPGSMGKPMPSLGICLLDTNGEPCDPGDEGEICINIANGIPAGVFHGYYHDEEKTSAAMHDGWYHTGDIAWQDEDGYFWFVGRDDDVIKSSGYRIGPFEVESAMLTHPAVLETAITAVPDPVRGQVVKATVVLAKGYTASEELKKDIQNHVKRVTAPYKYPRIVEFVDELPKTISGKIMRKKIREQDK